MRRIWWALAIAAALTAGCTTAPGAYPPETPDAAVAATTTPNVARGAPSEAPSEAPSAVARPGDARAPAAAVPAASAPGPSPPGAVPSAQDGEDAFDLRIDAGRTSVFNTKIADALNAMKSPYAPHESESILAVRQRDLRDAAAAVRQAAYEFLGLEASACAEGKFAAIACAGGPPPRWLGERPDAPVPAGEVRRRLEELQARMQPLLDAACAEGKRQTGDEMYCSVE
jgi:hypothetical protein